MRVGKYRVIYRYTEDGEVEILIVMDIGSRGDIYKSGLGNSIANKQEGVGLQK